MWVTPKWLYSCPTLQRAVIIDIVFLLTSSQRVYCYTLIWLKSQMKSSYRFVPVCQTIRIRSPTCTVAFFLFRIWSCQNSSIIIILCFPYTIRLAVPWVVEPGHQRPVEHSWTRKHRRAALDYVALRWGHASNVSTFNYYDMVSGLTTEQNRTEQNRTEIFGLKTEY